MPAMMPITAKVTASSTVLNPLRRMWVTVPIARSLSAGTGADTEPMSGFERHHWVNTLVGILDTAFVLTEEEQFFCAAGFIRLLDRLDIPGRSAPDCVPASLALERDGQIYSAQMSSGRNGATRTPRYANETDLVVPLEDWRDALSGMIFRAYPDLGPLERVETVGAIDGILVSLGIPGRAARHLPQDVIAAHRQARA